MAQSNGLSSRSFLGFFLRRGFAFGRFFDDAGFVFFFAPDLGRTFGFTVLPVLPARFDVGRSVALVAVLLAASVASFFSTTVVTTLALGKFSPAVAGALPDGPPSVGVTAFTNLISC